MESIVNIAHTKEILSENDHLCMTMNDVSMG